MVAGRLPSDIILQISSYLREHPPTIFSLRGTSRTLRKLIPAPTHAEILDFELLPDARSAFFFACMHCVCLRPGRAFGLRQVTEKKSCSREERWCIECGFAAARKSDGWNCAKARKRYGYGNDVKGWDGGRYVWCFRCRIAKVERWEGRVPKDGVLGLEASEWDAWKVWWEERSAGFCRDCCEGKVVEVEMGDCEYEEEACEVDSGWEEMDIDEADPEDDRRTDCLEAEADAKTEEEPVPDGENAETRSEAGPEDEGAETHSEAGSDDEDAKTRPGAGPDDEDAKTEEEAVPHGEDAETRSEAGPGGEDAETRSEAGSDVGHESDGEDDGNQSQRQEKDEESETGDVNKAEPNANSDQEEQTTSLPSSPSDPNPAITSTESAQSLPCQSSVEKEASPSKDSGQNPDSKSEPVSDACVKSDIDTAELVDAMEGLEFEAEKPVSVTPPKRKRHVFDVEFSAKKIRSW